MNEPYKADGLISLVLLAAILAVVLSLCSHAAGAEITQCSSSRQRDGEWWSYRIVDGRRCWYRGRPGRSKGLLRWNTDQPVKTYVVQSDPEPPPPPPPEPKIERWPDLPPELTAEALLLAVRPKQAEPAVPLPHPKPKPVSQGTAVWLAVFPFTLLAAIYLVMRFHPKQPERGDDLWQTSMMSYELKLKPQTGVTAQLGSHLTSMAADLRRLLPWMRNTILPSWQRRLQSLWCRLPQDQVNEANNNLEQTRAFADHLRANVAQKIGELTDMNGRLKAFGTSILAAHRQFHGEVAGASVPASVPPES